MKISCSKILFLKPIISVQRTKYKFKEIFSPKLMHFSSRFVSEDFLKLLQQFFGRCISKHQKGRSTFGWGPKNPQNFCSFFAGIDCKAVDGADSQSSTLGGNSCCQNGREKKKQEEVLQSSTVQDVNIFCKSRDNEHEKRNLSPKATSSQLAAALSLNLKS